MLNLFKKQKNNEEETSLEDLKEIIIEALEEAKPKNVESSDSLKERQSIENQYFIKKLKLKYKNKKNILIDYSELLDGTRRFFPTIFSIDEATLDVTLNGLVQQHGISKDFIVLENGIFWYIAPESDDIFITKYSIKSK